MTVVKALATIIILVLYWIIGTVTTVAACTAKRRGVDIPGVVVGNVATCTGDLCRQDLGVYDVVIDGCHKVVCQDEEFVCPEVEIQNTVHILCQGANACLNLFATTNITRVTCVGRHACRNFVIAAHPVDGWMDCRGGSRAEPACSGLTADPRSSIRNTGCLRCGVHGCGANVSFSDSVSQGKVGNGVVRNYGQSCRRNEKCQGIISCVWAWVTGLF